MARFDFRSGSASGAATPKFFSLAKQLATRRADIQAKAVKPVAVKPALTTSKQKESVIKETIEKSYLPSGLKLAKLRQLAAQHKIMGELGRKFLHETEAGKKIEGKEGLVKLDTDIIEAESEAVAAQGGHDPRTFEYRKDADHPQRLGKKMYGEQVHEASRQAAAEAASKHATLMEERQAHQSMIHGILDRGSVPAAAPAPAVSASHSSPSMIQPTPLPSSPTPTHTLPFAPMTGGGHITQEGSMPTTEPTNIGVPVAVHAVETPAPNREPVTPLPTPEPAPSTPVQVDVQLPDTSHLSDPFGGED